MSAKTLNFANFKGGVGKTTTGVMVATLLSKFGHKTLVVDFDPQGNASEMLMLTSGKQTIPKTIYEGIQDQTLMDCVMEIDENLDLIPSDMDLVGLPLYLNKTAKNDMEKRAYLMDFLLEPLKEQYDYIIIDAPPTISDYTNNAVVASDYVILVMQTHPWSYRATEKFVPYLQEMIDSYGTSIELLGIVPVLLKKDSKTDIKILENASAKYDTHLFESTIMIRERVKRYATTGITNDLIHDRKIRQMYGSLLKEILERIEQLNHVKQQ
uniref:ParA family protein n=1 Tax=Bacillaceae bacterium JMAK1 TaxID=1028381 RepID=UPI0003AC42F5|nr:ParA family protein [Bacillaceae bacterium JMAK1]AGQ45462.1 RepB [Bacillaceae bacterium JMAK1]